LVAKQPLRPRPHKRKLPRERGSFGISEMRAGAAYLILDLFGAGFGRNKLQPPETGIAIVARDLKTFWRFPIASSGRAQ
jgi:hypothetical protein